MRRATLTSLVVAAVSAGCLTPAEPTTIASQGSALVVERTPVAPASLIAGVTLGDGAPVFGGSAGILIARLGTDWVSIASPTDDLITGLAAVGDTLWLATPDELWFRVAAIWRRATVTPRGILLEARAIGDTLWLLGSGATLMRRTTTGIQQVEMPRTDLELWGIARHRDGHVAVGQNGVIVESRDGASWHEVSSGTGAGLFDVACRDDGRCIAVGTGGTILLRDGDSWEAAITPTSTNLFAVAVAEDGSFLVAGDAGTVLTGDGLRFASVPIRGPRENLRAFAGRGSTRAIGGWSSLVLAAPPAWEPVLFGSRLFAVHAPPDGPAIAAGAGGIALERGIDGIWRTLALPTEATLYGIDGPSARDRLAVGDSGMVLQFRGGAWTREAAPRRDLLRAVWYDGRRAMVVGAAGSALIRESGAWRVLPTDATVTFRDLDGRAWEDLWAVGDSGVVRRFDGTRWTRVAVPVEAVTLRGVHARRGREVWIVGDGGTVAHFDGITWRRVAAPAEEDLRVVTQLGAEVLVAGASGTVWRRTERGWSVVSTATPGFVLGASAGDARTPVYLVGEGSTILGAR
jgi:hypothetical protein